MAGLFAPVQKANNTSAADARLARENSRKAANIEAALTAFYTHAKPISSQRAGESLLAGIGLASIEEAQRYTPKVATKAERIAVDARIKPLGLPINEAALLSLAVKADERERGAALIQISRSDAADALGVPLDEAEAALNALQIRGLIRFYDNGSGDRGFRIHLPENPY